MTRRVVVWGTGTIGRCALRAVLDHPGLELVGVVVHDPAKEGRDAADLAEPAPAPRTLHGDGPYGATSVQSSDAKGVRATRDPAVALAARPDVVCYTAVGTGSSEVARADAAVADVCSVLAGGLDVVSTSITSMVYPPMADPGLRSRIERACVAGGTSCFVSGTHPGFATDLLPLTLAGLSAGVESIRLAELINYERWHKFTKLRDHFGFGHPPDYQPAIFQPGVVTDIWGSVVGMIADRLGMKVDRLEETHERWVTPTPFEVRAGTIEAGTMAAAKFSVLGYEPAHDQPVIVLDHVYRAHPDAAPDWEQPPGAGGYRAEVRGNPPWTFDLAMGEAGSVLEAGAMATAVRVVNAIPAVCNARPGLLTPADIPLVPGYHRPPASRSAV